MATSCPVYPDLNQLSLVRVDLSLPQIVERRPDVCSDKQGGLAFNYIWREESGAPDEGPRKNVVENGLMAKGDTEVVFRPDNKSECLQTLERSQTIIKARGRKPKRLFLRHLTSDTRGKGDEILAIIRRCNSVAPKLLKHCLKRSEKRRV